MSNDLVQPQNGGAAAPFGKMMQHTSVNAGAVAIESERAIAEARGKMQLAKMFPRDTQAAYSELMDACKLPALAEVAFYSVPRGGKQVTGPSVRLAEEIARVWGNIDYGHRELSRSDTKSEIEVFAWDKQTNTTSTRQITVMHVMDTKDGPRKLRDQKDVDDKIANVASKQLRGRILAIMPKWLVEAAIQECRKTLAGDNTVPLAERVRKMTQAFAPYGVTAEHLEKYLGHPIDKTLADELVELMGVYNALKEGAKASDYFGAPEEQSEATGTAAAITQQAKGAASKATSAKKQPEEVAAAQEGKPAESNSKPAKETRRESGHKDDTTQPQGAEATREETSGDQSQPQQDGDVF